VCRATTGEGTAEILGVSRNYDRERPAAQARAGLRGSTAVLKQEMERAGEMWTKPDSRVCRTGIFNLTCDGLTGKPHHHKLWQFRFPG